MNVLLKQPIRTGARRSTLRYLSLACVLLSAIALGGCEKTFENMYNQPKYKPLAESPLWADGRASRPPVPGTVPHSEGATAGTSSGRSGLVIAAPDVPKPMPLVAQGGAERSPHSEEAKRSGWTREVLLRGQQRFNIFCAPCHSEAGDGDGMIARRGFPHPPSFHIDRLRNAPDDYLYAVITHGYGDMYPYADRVLPDDRRAIVAYIRALQLSQDARISDLPPDARHALESSR